MRSAGINGTFKESPAWKDVCEIQRNSGLMLWRIRPEASGDQHLEVSDALLNMIGRTSSECPAAWKEFMTSFVHPEDWGEVETAFRDCAHRPLVPLHFEHRLLHADSGQWRWVRTTAQGKKIDGQDQAGEIFGGTLDVHDFYSALTDLHKIHHDLRQERQRLAAIINASDIVVWDWNLDEDQRTYGNTQRLPAKNGGENQDSSPQCVWEQLLNPEDRKRAKLEAERHARGETPLFEMEYRVSRPNGTFLWLLDRGRRVDHKIDGRSRRLMGVMTDITSQKDLERRLREDNERMELVTKATRIGAWDWNVRANTISFNEAYDLMMGYGPGELDGDLGKWHDHVHPEDRDRLYNHFISDVVGPDRIYESAVRMRHKNGHYINTYSMGRVVSLTEGGQAGRIVGIQFEPHKGLII